MRESTLGAVCMNVELDTAKNTKQYLRFIVEAANRGVDLLVFPEVSLQGYLLTNDTLSSHQPLRYYLEHAQKLSGPFVSMISECARKHDMYIQVGMAELNEPETVIYNSAVVVGPEGVLGTFRKVHSLPECPPFRPGVEFPVFDTAVGKIGPLICADLVFPESLRCLAVKGAVIGTMSTAYPMVSEDPHTDHNAYLYRTYANAQASMNQMWLIQSNYVGSLGGVRYFGNSRIVGPRGKAVAECGYEETLVIARVNIWDEIHKTRSYQRFVRLRRPELYGSLVEQDGVCR